jgi:hypothetical protein
MDLTTFWRDASLRLVVYGGPASSDVHHRRSVNQYVLCAELSFLGHAPPRRGSDSGSAGEQGIPDTPSRADVPPQWRSDGEDAAARLRLAAPWEACHIRRTLSIASASTEATMDGEDGSQEEDSEASGRGGDFSDTESQAWFDAREDLSAASSGELTLTMTVL